MFLACNSLSKNKFVTPLEKQEEISVEEDFDVLEEEEEDLSDYQIAAKTHKDTVFYTIANNGKIVKTQKSHSK